MPRTMHAMKTPVRRFLPLLACAIFGGALWLRAGELRTYHFAEALAYTRALPMPRLLIALVLTTCSYAALGTYDVLGVRYVGRAVPMRTVMAVSVVGYGISNTVGSAWLIGSAVRFRFESIA